MINLDRLRECLTYDPDTGVFTWKVNTSFVRRVGTRAGTVGTRVYRVIGIGGRRYYEHRLAWFIAHGEWPSLEIDHINGDKQDNRLANLRLASRADNNRNVVRNPARQAAVKGVRKRRNRFEARIRDGHRQLYLGTFDTAEEAGAAYQSAANRLHGQFVSAA